MKDFIFLFYLNSFKVCLIDFSLCFKIFIIGLFFKGFLLILGEYFIILIIMRSSAVLHSRMLSSLIRSKIKFFETTPIGRIINRTSKDLNNVDFQLANSFKQFTNLFLGMITSLITISINSTPYFPLVFFIFGVIYLVIQVSLNLVFSHYYIIFCLLLKL